ncbi:MAG: hypothetical protein ACYDGR_05030 [Candidatus Dormibacteria bacterium]
MSFESKPVATNGSRATAPAGSHARLVELMRNAVRLGLQTPAGATAQRAAERGFVRRARLLASRAGGAPPGQAVELRRQARQALAHAVLAHNLGLLAPRARAG